MYCEGTHGLAAEVALVQVAGNGTLVICCDVPCCPYPNDENVHWEDVATVIDHVVETVIVRQEVAAENVICREVAEETEIFPEAVEVAVNESVHWEEEVWGSVNDVFLQ